jgi:hypothetical protein
MRLLRVRYVSTELFVRQILDTSVDFIPRIS